MRYTERTVSVIKRCVDDLSFLWEKEPLEDDVTVEIANIFKNELDIVNGNIHPDDHRTELRDFNIDYLSPDFKTRKLIGYKLVDKYDNYPQGMNPQGAYPIDLCLQMIAKHPQWLMAPVYDNEGFTFFETIE